MKLNEVFLRGRVQQTPKIVKGPDGEYAFGYVTLDVVRGLRSVGDNADKLQHNYPIVLSREKEQLDEISKWETNDVVLVQGVLSTKNVQKTRICPYCTDADGNQTQFKTPYLTVYVTPKYCEKIRSYGDDEAAKIKAMEDVVEHREISCKALVYGVILKDPKFLVTKNKTQITQYPIATNRKFLIRTDDPSVKTDYPWVKAYGENARNDKTFLHYQSEIEIDGFLQTRRTHPVVTCPMCGKSWKIDDTSMELVPYATEYIANFRTPEDVENEMRLKVEEYKQMLFDSAEEDEGDMSEDQTNDEAAK
jgi:hypothetical protein